MNHGKPSSTRPRKGGKRDGLFQRNGWWWLDYYDAEGKRHRQKAAPDYDTAKKMYRERMTSIVRGELLGIREEGLRVREFIDKKYWPTIEGTLSRHERRRLRGILDRQVLPNFGNSILTKLRQEDIEHWQSERLKKVSPATVKKESMWLKHLLYRAVRWNYLKGSPAKNIIRITEPPGRVRYLTTQERSALLQHARSDLKPFIFFAMQTGARQGELCGLRWSDVDMRTHSLIFPRTKNGSRRVVPMTDSLHKMLAHMARPIDTNSLLLPALSEDAVGIGFRRLTEKLRISDLHFHDLRHDVASTLTMAGVPQRSIMEILGHRDPRMTLRYQHLTPAHLKNAMRSLDSCEVGLGTVSDRPVSMNE